jgi:hypothetical protein
MEETLNKTWRKVAVAAGLVVVSVLLSASACQTSVANLMSLMKGRSATIITYDVFGRQLDKIHGASIDIQRDTTFDSTNADGSSNKDSSVITVSIGGGVMTHVGSTLLMIEDGITNINDKLPPTVTLENTERGTPFLNYLRQNFRNFWSGTSRTILVRSQNGYPIGIFGGNKVTYYATNVPKSTLLNIDGKYLLIYRSDYSMYDNRLLDS